MKRIDSLDGLRGLAAMWVMIGHCLNVTGFRLPIFGRPDLGVDLFIYLSGFLMVFQYMIRKEREDWASPTTWTAFWVRRFFRLSPLYFVMLFAALYFGTNIAAEKQLIYDFFRHKFPHPDRYNDISVENIVLHVTYLFGLFPAYAYRTPLPDWSLGLEMQFYAVFPFAVLLARRYGWLRSVAGLAIISVLIAALSHAAGFHFPKPSFLPLKFHVFLAGMLIAAASDTNKWAYAAVAAALAALPIGGTQNLFHLVAREFLLAVLFLVIHVRSNAVIQRLSMILGSRPFYWLGELSFGAYLIHLLVMYPVTAWVLQRWEHNISAGSRFALVFAIVSLIVYSVSLATYFLIERPGQRLGKALLEYVGLNRASAQTSPEKIAAP